MKSGMNEILSMEEPEVERWWLIVVRASINLSMRISSVYPKWGICSASVMDLNIAFWTAVSGVTSPGTMWAAAMVVGEVSHSGAGEAMLVQGTCRLQRTHTDPLALPGLDEPLDVLLCDATILSRPSHVCQIHLVL